MEMFCWKVPESPNLILNDPFGQLGPVSVPALAALSKDPPQKFPFPIHPSSRIPGAVTLEVAELMCK